ncbi:MAG: bacillithiol biosynthesis BshC [Archangium sp.]
MSAFAPAFLKGEARALAFLSDDFRRAEGRAAVVRRVEPRACVVADALAAQASRRPSTASRMPAIEALRRGEALAVVTGQQVGLFLGPLYSVFKAATAIVVARQLSEETGARCVPVFWLQSEDHDFAEINHTTVHGREGDLTRLLLASPHVARASVSSIKLGEGVGEALFQLQSAIESLPFADEVRELFSRHYTPSATWVDAFAGVMSELFPELVVLDPRDERIAAAVRGVHERAFAEREAITRVLQERERALEAAGFDVQVKVREVPLSFVHPEGRDGPRHRGEKIVSDDPLCLSSSALLRPIIQDTLLPTAAIVGGPGELNYFAQLAPLYAHFGMQMPMVMPRARFRVVEPRARALLGELGLQASEVEVPREVLLKRLVHAREGELSAAELERRLVDSAGAVLSGVPVPAAPAGEKLVGMARAVERTRRSIARAAQRFALRYGRELSTRDAIVTARVDRVQRALFPGGEPQERVLGIAGFAARIGVQKFVELVRAGVTPFGTEVKELQS